MEILEQLDEQIEELLKLHQQLKEQNGQLQKDISALRAEKAALEDEKNHLTAELAREEELRGKALERVDGILAKLRAHLATPENA